MRRRRILVLALVVTAVAGCGTTPPAGGDEAGLDVVAAFYPYQFLAERVGGEDVTVAGLTKAGGEPHDLELTPQQMAGLGAADLVVYAAGFQPAVDDAVDGEAVDVAFDVNAVAPLQEGYVPLEDGELVPDEQGADPHVWLDPLRYAGIATALAEQLAELRPEAADGFRQRAGALTAELEALDAELAAGLESCERREIVTSHNAFGYLADRYQLEQVAVTGLNPEDEPTARRLAEVAQLAKARGVTTVFFEELVSPRTAQSLAREVGAKAQVLSPLESAPEEGDYLSAMRANLDILRVALGCR